MLVASGAANTSGKSVTTLIVSIGLFHGDEVVAPRLYGVARSHADERKQPLAVIRAPPRDDQRPRYHPPLGAHDVEPGLGREHRARILHQREDRHLPPLPVRLAQPPD